MSAVTLKIEGMSCGHCVSGVTKALKAIKGVQDADVNLDQKSARVEYDPAATSVDAMKRAVAAEGYQVVGVESI